MLNLFGAHEVAILDGGFAGPVAMVNARQAEIGQFPVGHAQQLGLGGAQLEAGHRLAAFGDLGVDLGAVAS